VTPDMSTEQSAANGDIPRLESLLANLLHYGTFAASAIIALGLALPLASGQWSRSPQLSLHIVEAGIALFILLPVLRVLLMLIVFVRQRDHRYTAIAATVLVIILLGFALGVCLSKATRV
jgi:Protein of unknown function (DUF1634)